jgi:hypothetical protein
MKLTHLANLLTIALLLVTAWLAWEASKEAKLAGDKVDRLTAHQRATEAYLPVSHDDAATKFIPSPMAQTPAATPSAEPIAPVPPSTPVAAPKPNVPTIPAGSEPTAAALAAAGSPKPPTLTPTAPPPAAPSVPGALTPLQRRVKDAPSMGKVKDFVAEHGFITFQAPADFGLKPGMKFDLRRDAAVVGRITIDVIEPDAVIANLDPKSVPEGVEVKVGDDIISVMAPMPQ